MEHVELPLKTPKKFWAMLAPAQCIKERWSHCASQNHPGGWVKGGVSLNKLLHQLSLHVNFEAAQPHMNGALASTITQAQ